MKDTKILTDNNINLEQSLELLGDIEFYEETLQEFLQEIDSKIENMKNYKEVGDMPNYAILVHSLKSDSKYLGFTTLAELAYQQELESKQNNSDYINEHFEELTNELNRILNVLKQYLENE